jgi:methyltransferase (TIGR00027 family)
MIDFPSRTAAIHFKMRGLHHQIDTGPVIFNDAKAVELHSAIDFDEDLNTGFWTSIRSNMLFRFRIAEYHLKKSIANGTRQYVILGAGLDTFASRQPSWANEVKVFQVDYPDVILKRNKILGKHGINVACDITELTIDRLVKKGLDPSKPVFFSMLGVSMYIDHDNQQRIYSEIASLKKCQLVMTHMDIGSSDHVKRIAEAVAENGEPFKGRIQRKKLIEMLEAAGFENIDKPGGDFINDWYKESSLPKPNLNSITIASKFT